MKEKVRIDKDVVPQDGIYKRLYRCEGDLWYIESVSPHADKHWGVRPIESDAAYYLIDHNHK